MKFKYNQTEIELTSPCCNAGMALTKDGDNPLPNKRVYVCQACKEPVDVIGLIVERINERINLRTLLFYKEMAEYSAKNWAKEWRKWEDLIKHAPSGDATTATKLCRLRDQLELEE